MPDWRILFLSNVVPYPPHGGIQQRLFHLSTRIARTHSVTLGCHAWDGADLDGAEWLTRNGIRTVVAPVERGNWRLVLPAIGAALIGRPPEIVQYQSPLLHALIRDEHFDIVHVEESLLAPYARSIPSGANTRTLLTFVDVRFQQAARIAGLEHGWRRWWLQANAGWMRRYEPAVAARFDRVIAVSEVDAALLRGAAPGLRVDLVPNGVDTERLTMLEESERKKAILFVGALNYRPCIDAAQWLVRGILPLVREYIPGIELWIAGSNATREVEALAGSGVFIASSVPDLIPYYQRASVAVAPLRAGSGSRLKILEAMALGRPVVSTSLGAEGLAVQPGKHLLIADDEPQFAQAIAHVIMNDTFRRALLQSARRFVEDSHSWDFLVKTQLGIYDEVMEGAPG